MWTEINFNRSFYSIEILKFRCGKYSQTIFSQLAQQILKNPTESLIEEKKPVFMVTYGRENRVTQNQLYSLEFSDPEDSDARRRTKNFREIILYKKNSFG